MSKLTGISTGVVSLVAFVPWLVALVPHGRSLGWWSAAIVYPVFLSALVLLVAVIRDVAKRRYLALLAPVIVAGAGVAGFLIWLLVVLATTPLEWNV